MPQESILITRYLRSWLHLGVPLIQVIIVEQKLTAVLAPADGVEEDVEPTFLLIGQWCRRAVALILLHPLPELSVVTPIAVKAMKSR